VECRLDLVCEVESLIVGRVDEMVAEIRAEVETDNRTYTSIKLEQDVYPTVYSYLCTQNLQIQPPRPDVIPPHTFLGTLRVFFCFECFNSQAWLSAKKTDFAKMEQTACD